MGSFEGGHNSSEQETILENFERKFCDIVDLVGEKVDGILENEEDKEKLKLHEVELLRIVDGDTIEVKYNGEKEIIRMIGIDTPEKYRTKKSNYLKECFGDAASDYITQLLSGKEVYLEFDETQNTRGKYKRLLAYVRADGENINLKMIEDGYAYAYTYDYSNPCKYQTEFYRAQLKVEFNNRGLWHPDSCNGQRAIRKPH